MNNEAETVSRLNTTAEIVSYAGLAPFVLCLLGVAVPREYEYRELAQRIARLTSWMLAGNGASPVRRYSWAMATNPCRASMVAFSTSMSARASAI